MVKKVEIFTTSTFSVITLLFNAVFLIELLNTSTSLVCFLLSSIEWMAFGTDFYVNLFLSRTCNKGIAAVAGNSCLIVIWMDSFSHDFHLFYSYR